MLDLPRSTVLNRRIPKQKFYENISVTPHIKRIFVEQINQIIWQNKIAPSTVNVAAGKVVTEIEVFCLKLNRRGLDVNALQLMDKEIPYHLLFLLEYERKVQARIGYKEENMSKAGTFKIEGYYCTDWLATAQLSLRLDGLNMDMMYESFVRQIAGDRLAADKDMSIQEAVARDVRRQKLLKEVTALELRVQRELQFSRQVELNGQLKKLKMELEEI